MFCMRLDADATLDTSMAECTTVDEENDNLLSLLSEVCEAISSTNDVRFYVSGFGQMSWPTDVATDLLTIMAQMSDLVKWLYSSPRNVFDLDFYEQGLERTVHMEMRDERIYMTCVSRTAWKPSPKYEECGVKDLQQMIVDLVEVFVTLTKTVCHNMYQHKWYQQWISEVTIK